MSDRNALGGKNKNSLYVPMSETEQEFVNRLIAVNTFNHGNVIVGVS